MWYTAEYQNSETSRTPTVKYVLQLDKSLTFQV